LRLKQHLKEKMMTEETIQEIDLDAVAGTVEACMQSPECTDTPTG
jgi:hypothetical protein